MDMGEETGVGGGENRENTGAGEDDAEGGVTLSNEDVEGTKVGDEGVVEGGEVVGDEGMEVEGETLRMLMALESARMGVLWPLSLQHLKASRPLPLPP